MSFLSPLRCPNAASSARSFLQLVRRTYSTNLAPSHTPLEFLVPSGAAQSSIRSPSLSVRVAFNKGSPLPARAIATSAGRAITRSFTTSAIRHATVCVRNPVKDEDGTEMMLEITPRAAKRLAHIMAKDANPNLALRIQVESGGCHGFQYLMSLITLPPSDLEQQSSVVTEEDSIFQFVPDSPEEPIAQDAAPKIILDEPSLELLKGSKVDFTVELIGSEFKIVDNPLASSSCGCGTSFDIKI
ncbi:iron transport [Paramyrothecium foliicola]|nr:iron transport [Paramyrothecium foliicola]